MTGIKRSPCATPHGGLLYGHLDESTPLRSYEPKTCIDVSAVGVEGGGVEQKDGNGSGT